MLLLLLVLLMHYALLEESFGFRLHLILKAQSLDEKKIAILNDSSQLSLWDGKTGKLLNRSVAEDLHNVVSLDFNKEGTKLIVTTDEGSQEFSY